MSASAASIDSEVETVVFEEVALHLSARHFPVLVVTWFGVPTPEAVDGYATWLERVADRAQAEGTKLAVLGDMRGIEARPGPDVRRAMAASIERIQTGRPGCLLGVTTIIGEPVMRAVITMVLAITRTKIDLQPVKDLEQGIARTFALLEAAGIPRPPGLDASSYQRPSRPQ